MSKSGDEELFFEDDFEDEVSDGRTSSDSNQIVIQRDELFSSSPFGGSSASSSVSFVSTKPSVGKINIKKKNEKDKENDMKVTKDKRRTSSKSIKKKVKKKVKLKLRNDDRSVNWGCSDPCLDSMMGRLQKSKRKFRKKGQKKVGSSSSSSFLPPIQKKNQFSKTSSVGGRSEISTRTVRSRESRRNKVRKRRRRSLPAKIPKGMTDNIAQNTKVEAKEIKFMKNRMRKLKKSTDIKDQIRVLEMERIQREGKFNSMVVDENQVKFLKAVEGIKKSLEPSKKKQTLLRSNINLLQKKNEKLLGKFYEVMNKRT